MQVCERACLEVAVECKIADLLRNKPEGIHVNELGNATGIEPGKLGRVMRYLATTHMFQEGRIQYDTLSSMLIMTENSPSRCLCE